MELFSTPDKDYPLSVRLRPNKLEEFIGQEHILAEGKLLRRLLISDRLQSLIFYGPPGTGKTTLANIIAKTTRSRFTKINAVTSGVPELKKVIDEAITQRKLQGQKTILFIDEIHRFNKAQQDVLLPFVENSDIILIGATTYNPYFYIIGPLSSRTFIFELQPLSFENMEQLLDFALEDTNRGYGNQSVELTKEAREYLIYKSNGDARKLLNALELGVLTSTSKDPIVIDLDTASELIQQKKMVYDRDGDNHYDLASALIKSMRGSDPDAAVYYLARMITGGEDVRFIARRCAILACEDIGLAEPQAVNIANSCFNLVANIGMPEAQIILGYLVIYLSLCPKSNSTYLAINKAIEYIQEEESLAIPDYLKDSSYKSAKKLNRGKGYKYPHDFPNHYVDQAYLKKTLQFYFPTLQGNEKKLVESLNKIQNKEKL